MRRFNVKQGN